MARKTAMRSEPKGSGRVSIAVPKPGKERFLPPVKPPPMDNKGNFTQPKPQRLSPGVYRGAGGGLVNSKGRPLPGQSNAQRAITGAIAGANQQPAPRPSPGVVQGAVEGIGAAMGGNLGSFPSQQQMGGMADEAGFYQMPAMRWNGQGNGPGSPNDINEWFNPNQQMPDMMQRLQMNPNAPMYQQPMNGLPPQNLIYQYPPGQAPAPGTLFNRMQQQPQQPNTVSGLLQKRFQ